MKIHHVAVKSRNIPATIEWYRKNFKAEVDYIDDSWAMLSIGDTKLALVTPSQHPNHIAIEIESFNDFPDGSEVKQHRDGSWYSYDADPDGNVVEFIYLGNDYR
jgi:catechol 2,3-dioxygenase-like lactoylglutathione lyase family enzyme